MNCLDFAPFTFQHKAPEAKSGGNAIRDVRETSDEENDKLKCKY